MNIKNLSLVCLTVTLVACGGSMVDLDGTIGTPGLFAFKAPQAITVPAVDPTFAALATGGPPSFGITGVSADGKMVGGYGEMTANGIQYDLYVWGAPNQAPVHLPMTNHRFYINSINRKGQMVGIIITSGHYTPAYWESPTTAPVIMAALHADTEATTINDDGEIVGVDYQGNQSHILHWTSKSATPTLLAEPAGNFSDSPKITKDGTIFARVSAIAGMSSPTFVAKWTNAASTGVILPDQGTPSPDSTYYFNLQSSSVLVQDLKTGVSTTSGAVYAAPSLTIKLVSGTGVNLPIASVLGRDESVYGNGNAGTAMAWKDTTTAPVTFQSLLPVGTTGYDQAHVTFVTATGTVIGWNTSASDWFFAERK